MPQIPVKKEQVNIRSGNLPNTGIRTSNINIDSQVYDTAFQAGGQLTQVGVQAARMARVREERDKRLGADVMHQDYQSQGQQYWKAVSTSEGQESIKAWDEYNKWKGEIRDYTDLSQVKEGEFGYIGDRLKKIGLTDQDKQEFQLKKAQYLDALDSKMYSHIAKAERQVFVQVGAQGTGLRMEEVLSGSKDLVKAIGETQAYYESKGYAPEFYEPMVEADTQALTSAFLDKAIDGKDMKIVEAILRGDYDDELTDIFKASGIVNTYRDRAKEAQKDYRVDLGKVKHDVEANGWDLKKTKEEIRADDSFTREEQEKIIDYAKSEWSNNNAIETKARAEGLRAEENKVQEFINQRDIAGLDSYLNTPGLYTSKKTIASIRKGFANGEDPFKQFDPEMEIELDENFQYMASNPSEVDLDRLQEKVLDKYGRGKNGGINRSMKNSYLSQITTMRKAGVKADNPLTQSDYLIASDTLKEFEAAGGYLERAMKEYGKTFGDDILPTYQARAMELYSEDKQKIKSMKLNDPEFDMKAYTDSVIIPEQEAQKKHWIGRLLDNVYDLGQEAMWLYPLPDRPDKRNVLEKKE